MLPEKDYFCHKLIHFSTRVFTRRKSFSALYGIQRIFLILFYLISAISVFWLLFYILHDLMNAGGMIIVPFTLAYLIFIVILYSFLHVITYIPANLAAAFDPIKNDIACNKIVNGKELADRLSRFMTSFFNFSFFDIDLALVRIRDDSSLFPGDFTDLLDDIDMDQMEMISKENDDTAYMGKIRSGKRIYYMYVTPLVFGEEWLGYVAVFSRSRLWKIFRHLLAEFENDFVDDQVVHVLSQKPETGAC